MTLFAQNAAATAIRIAFVALLATPLLCRAQARAEPRFSEPIRGYETIEGILRSEPRELGDFTGVKRALEGNSKLINHYERQEAFSSLSRQLNDSAPRGLSHTEFKALLLARVQALVVTSSCEDHCDTRGEVVLALIATSKKLENLSGYDETSLKGLTRLLTSLWIEFQMINPAPLADGKRVDAKVNEVVRNFLSETNSQITPDEFIRLFVRHCLI